MVLGIGIICCPFVATAAAASASSPKEKGAIMADMDPQSVVRPVNGGQEGLVLPAERPLPAGPDSPPLPAELFAVPVVILDAILTRLPPVPLPIRHLWGDGFLVREMLIPAGTLIVARRYKVPHVCICSAGSITVWGEGVEPLIIEAPFSVAAEPGVQRVGYAHEDTLWSTVLPNPGRLTDPEAILDACAEITSLAYRDRSFEELLELAGDEVRQLIGTGEALSCRAQS